MSGSSTVKSEQLTKLVNGIIQSTQHIIPIDQKIEKPTLLKTVSLEFGVIIGFVGDLEGRLLLKGEPNTFSLIGEKMFGMALSDEMVSSFSGELGNMIAGNLSTVISQQGINTDITSPIIMEGNTQLSGFNRAININLLLSDVGSMNIVLLLDF